MSLTPASCGRCALCTPVPAESANWKADSGNRWTVPAGGGRVFKVGNQPINSRLEAYCNVVRPNGAPDWQISFTWQCLFPK